MENTKKRIFSGIQPSGNLTIGNYLGALRNWVQLQDDYECIYCVVNMHAITVRQDPAVLRRRSLETMAIFLACGISPEKSILFIQSHIPEHTMLNWVMCCNTYMGEAQRMTQFKDKSARHADNINTGLFTYPVLMASDILLYQADLVPVGADQKQHIELTRDLCTRFNNTYGETFVLPEPYIPKIGARIMSLQEPQKTMSKSDPNPNAFICILDEPDVIVRKLKRAVTDSEGVIAYDPDNRAGVSNLLSIYAACTGKSMDQSVKDFEGQGYGSLKNTVADVVVDTLSPIQAEYNRIISDKEYLSKVIEEGDRKASAIAQRTMRKVYHKVGLDSK
ncbi:MAG: tryptophan--tRNA ligase [Eubacteriales bacterium]|nr:tryptophan--tRNA ligase [Eubacteriales bacterium]